MPPYAIELKGITKAFGPVVANDGIGLSVSRGEILALLGENGSGKTTLMNMLSGIYKPDSGSIFVDGRPVSIQSPEDAKRLGIGMVHQHFKLVEDFSAADNIWIGAEAEPAVLSRSRYDKIRALGHQYGFEIDPKKRVSDMSVTEKQTVEILKVLYYGADILILDEPTAVLTLQETRRLFAILRRMRDAGCAIIIITHKLNEVMELSDRVTILRKGKSVGTVVTAGTNARELTDLMVGRAVELAIGRPRCGTGEPLLTLKNVTVLSEDAGADMGALAIDDVSFTVEGGEILGIAGVSGCGQKELCEAIAGLRKIKSGKILYKTEHIEGMSPREIIRRGVSMSFIPEDRLGMGLAASCSVTDNMMLKNYRDPAGPFVDRKSARRLAEKVIRELDVVTPGTETPVRRLSGGNVQKVLLGREIEIEPTVLITAYPVRGLDINSSYTIYNILNEQKKRGVGILFIGEDLDVMLELCDRILVLCHGKVTGVVDAAATNKEELGLMMTAAQASASHGLDRTAPCESGAGRPATVLADVSSDGGITNSHLPESPDPTIQSSDNNFSTFQKVKPIHKPAPKPVLGFRVAGRAAAPLWQNALLYAGACLLALVLGGIFVALNHVNPLDYYWSVFSGCFKNYIYLTGYINIVTPLLITSIGIALAFKMRFWNIGANGQFIAGAICANAVGLALQNNLQQWLTLLLMLLAGILGGGLFGLIPAAARVKWGTSETLITLMLNYVAFYFLAYLKNTMFFRKVSASGAAMRPDFKPLPAMGWLYSFKIGHVKIDISLILALLLVIGVFIYLKYSKQGYEIAIVGESRKTAAYAGMNVNRIVIRTMFLSAAIAGGAGMLQLSGSATGHAISENISGDVGWTGIVVAWLAKLNPFGILIVTLLLAILQKGTSVAQSAFGIPDAAASILQGIILFTVLAADFFIQYRIVRIKK